jgi:hypothetical protein
MRYLTRDIHGTRTRLTGTRRLHTTDAEPFCGGRPRGTHELGAACSNVALAKGCGRRAQRGRVICGCSDLQQPLQRRQRLDNAWARVRRLPIECAAIVSGTNDVSASQTPCPLHVCVWPREHGLI